MAACIFQFALCNFTGQNMNYYMFDVAKYHFIIHHFDRHCGYICPGLNIKLNYYTLIHG